MYFRPGDRVKLTQGACRMFPYYAGREGVITERREGELYDKNECFYVKWDYVKTVGSWSSMFLEPAVKMVPAYPVWPGEMVGGVTG